MAVKANKEGQGFTLLQEDSIEDSPAVKKFVASVLDKKDLKNHDVATSFRNLMDYREAPSSPTGGSHSAMEGDGMGSPTTPTSPLPPGAAGSGHTERLPNELLDEICEDIGMKSGDMELDFVEFLMEQDMDPQAYMTPEAILNSGLGSGGSNAVVSISGSSSNISTPTNSSSGGSGCGCTPVNNASSSGNVRQGVDPDWLSHVPSPVVSGSGGTTTTLSSGSNSPATKRMHLAASEQNSPNRESNNSQLHGSSSMVPPPQSPQGKLQVFKMPHTPPTPRRSLSCPQGGFSSGGSGSGNLAGSCGSSMVNSPGLPSKGGRFSPRSFDSNGQYTKDENDRSDSSLPCSNSGNAYACNFLYKHSDSLSRTQCYSPKQFSSCEHARRGSTEGSMQIAPNQQSQPDHVPHYHNLQPHQQLIHQQHQQMAANKDSFHKLGKPPPPNINVKNFPQMRWAGGSMQGHPHHAMGMGNKNNYGYPVQGHPHPGGPGNRIDSPLDQGYFSNESAGNGTSSSAPSPALTISSVSSISSLSSMSSLSTMMPADPSPKTSGPPSMVSARQKSVHFADLPQDGSSPDAMCHTPVSSAGMDMQGYARFSSNPSPSDCAFDMDSAQQKAMQSKILPRHNHHGVKPGVAPYTVPCNTATGPVVTGNYDFNNRSCCALNQQNRSSPADAGSGSMQQFEFSNSGVPNKGLSGDGMFYVDNNQNMMRMDSSPGLDYSVGSGAYSGSSSGYSLPVNQMRAAQQQQQQQGTMSAAQMMPIQQAPPDSASQDYSSCSMMPQGPQRISNAQSGQMGNYGGQHNMGMQMNGSGHICMGMNMPNSAMNMQPGHLNMQGQVIGPPQGHDGMNGMGPSHSHSFQPPSMSTPCIPRLQGTGRGPMQSPSYAQGPPGGYDYTMGGRPPANMDPQMFSSHQQQMPGMMSPHGPGSAWSGPTSPPSLTDFTGSQHPSMGHPQMKPPHGIPTHSQQQPSVPMQAMVMGQQQPPSHPGSCTGGINCAGCKASRPAAKAFSSQQKFIQHLIMDESNSAYRSHPLYPLLRDLVIAGMNFDDPKFHYQQLLSLLPHDFEKLLQNFLHRNPPSGNYQSNFSVESVLMDSLKLAHSHLVEKIRARQEQEKLKAMTSTSIRSMEEFCEKFDHAQMVGMGQPGNINGCTPLLMAGPAQMGEMSMQGPLHIMTSVGPSTKVMVALGQGAFVAPGMAGAVGFRPLKDVPDLMGDGSGNVGAAGQKTESKKHPSLPKEAVSLMMEWLRGHKDNPYPNDDEKAMLIKQTGLTINQINYWFTNARRRILPKWAQCK